MPCNIVILTSTWAAPYTSRSRNELVSSIHTSFQYNTLPLPQSSDLLPTLDMDCPIVNQDDFFGCFHYDCCNVDMLSLFHCLVGHNDINQESFLGVCVEGEDYL